MYHLAVAIDQYAACMWRKRLFYQRTQLERSDYSIRPATLAIAKPTQRVESRLCSGHVRYVRIGHAAVLLTTLTPHAVTLLSRMMMTKIRKPRGRRRDSQQESEKQSRKTRRQIRGGLEASARQPRGPHATLPTVRYYYIGAITSLQARPEAHRSFIATCSTGANRKFPVGSEGRAPGSWVGRRGRDEETRDAIALWQMAPCYVSPSRARKRRGKLIASLRAEPSVDARQG